MLLMEERVSVGSEPNEAPADERQLVDRDPPAELGVAEGEGRVGVKRVAQVLGIEIDRDGSWISACPAAVPAGNVVR